MKNAVNIVLAAAMLAILLLASTSAYSAYVSSTSHRSSCARTDLILNTFHDVIALAFTPEPGQTLTAKQAMAAQTFEAKAFARIDQARCR